MNKNEVKIWGVFAGGIIVGAFAFSLALLSNSVDLSYTKTFYVVLSDMGSSAAAIATAAAIFIGWRIHLRDGKAANKRHHEALTQNSNLHLEALSVNARLHAEALAHSSRLSDIDYQMVLNRLIVALEHLLSPLERFTTEIAGTADIEDARYHQYRNIRCSYEAFAPAANKLIIEHARDFKDLRVDTYAAGDKIERIISYLLDRDFLNEYSPLKDENPRFLLLRERISELDKNKEVYRTELIVLDLTARQLSLEIREFVENLQRELNSLN